MSALAATQAELSTGQLLPTTQPLGWNDYLRLYGALPLAGEELLEEIDASGLSGRGGAGFPTARKLQTVAAAGLAVVVANGTEGEPASWKDETLLRLNPHLVIDGALLAAELVGARRVILAVPRDSTEQVRLSRALAARPDGAGVEVVAAPARFVAGEESALVHWLNDGEAKPTGRRRRPFEQGVDGRPTLVQNVETLANIALIARYGGDWFRCEETVLVTVGGAVHRPGVVEVPLGIPFPQLFSLAGGLSEPVQAYLIGGYFGRWIAPHDTLDLSPESLGVSLGARTIAAFPKRSCAISETARVVSYMAEQSAGQCGPCLFGLQALARRMTTIAKAQPGATEAIAGLERLAGRIAGRGACAHPDGVVAFAASAAQVFAAELAVHAAGRCTARDHQPLLPTPRASRGWR